MKEIILSQNKVALVDDDTYEELNKYKWFYSQKNNCSYAIRHSIEKNGQKTIKMHREVMRLKYKDGKQVDHKDGNGLNNQKYNLRICSYSENQQNRKKVFLPLKVLILIKNEKNGEQEFA